MTRPSKYKPRGKRILDAPGRIRRPAAPLPDRVEHMVTRPDGRTEICACILGDDHVQGGDA